MNKIQALEIFIVIVEAGSFTKAAEQLNLHTSQVSKALKFLETNLGIKLINRTTRKLILTAEGELFYAKAVNLLCEFEKTFNNLSSATKQAEGKIRLDISPAITAFLVAKLPEFQKNYPKIQLVIYSQDKINDLVNEGLDCAIRLGELEDSSYVAKKLANLKMTLACSPKYLENYQVKKPQNLEELKNHLAINYFSTKTHNCLAWEFFNKQGEIELIKLKSAILVNDSNTLLHCLLAGMGISYLPKILIEPYLKRGELVELLTEQKIPNRPLWLIYTQREFIPKRMEVFFNFLSQSFKNT